MFGTCRTYWFAAGVSAVLGVVVVWSHFDVEEAWFFIGLTLLLCSGQCINGGLVSKRSHTLDEEFDAGYRVGYRAGRRRRTPHFAHLDDRRHDTGLSKAPLGLVAGDHRTPARRPSTHHD